MKSLIVYPVSVSLLGSNIPSAPCSWMPLIQEITLHIMQENRQNDSAVYFNLHTFRKQTGRQKF